MRKVAADLQSTILDGIIGAPRLPKIVSDASAHGKRVRSFIPINHSTFT